MDDDAAERLVAASQGSSAESIVVFLAQFQPALHPRVTLADTDRFRARAFESWRDNTYEPLRQRCSDVEALYRAMRYLRIRLGVSAQQELVVAVAADLLPGWPACLRTWAARRAASRLLKHACLRQGEDGALHCPDFQLDGFGDVQHDDVSTGLRGAARRLRRAEVAEGLCFALGRDGQYREALVAGRRGAGLEPSRYRCWVGAGMAARKLGHLEQAERAFQRAVELAPKAPEPLLGLAGLRSDQGRYQDAEGLWFQVVRLTGWEIAWRGLAVARQQMEDRDGTISAARNALQVDSTSGQAYIVLGTAQMAKRDWLGAVKAFYSATAFEPEAVTAWLGLGCARIVTGDAAGAEFALKRALALHPEYAEAHYYLGELFALTDRPEEALANLQAAVRLDEALCERARTSGNLKPLHEDPRFWTIVGSRAEAPG
jgi:tetratricopeptide (TPR) repeat protein